ncbi:MAG: amino acid transporter [Chlamydiales bacterium]|nr:amino acid transporter [Chlamydiia bacterium]MCP5506756.1 amino acid transporter [Chlamydiales bacterium]
MFLVAGCCIGGGMLALPMASGVSGFVPSLLMMTICWIAMTLSALLLLEVTLWMGEGAHFISMSERFLGLPGKIVSWVLYLFVCYASVVAYSAGGGKQVSWAVVQYFGIDLSPTWGCILFTFLFTAVVYMGSNVVGRVNSILFSAMILSYIVLISMGIDQVKPELLLYHRWSQSLIAIPLLLTVFSFQTMVPSLVPILKRNTRALRWSVMGGTFIAFIVYALWQCLILGIVPVNGDDGLMAALSKNEMATQFLSKHISGTWVVLFAEYFAFFAIVTSFLAMTLGLFDFLSDGLKIPENGIGQAILGVIVVFPTIVIATKFERAFMVALETTGGFGDTILNGMIPVMMVWIGRYKMGLQSDLKVPGGKPVLVVIFLFFFCALMIEILGQLGYLCPSYEFYDILEAQNLITS